MSRCTMVAESWLAVKHLDHLAYVVRAVFELLSLVVGEVQFDYLLDTTGSEFDRNTDEEVVEAVFALQVGRARQDALLVQQDRIHHLHGGRSRRVEGAPASQQLDDLAAAPPGPLYDGFDPVLGQELRDRYPAHGSHARQRHHRVAVPAQDEREDFAHRHLELLGDKGAVAGGVEDSSLADDPLPGEAARLQGNVTHRVQRVRHHHDDGVGGVLHCLLDHAADDLLVVVEQVRAAHPRLPGFAAGYHDDVRVCGILVVIRADDARIEADNGTGLENVQRLALWQPFDDVHQHHVGVVPHGEVQGYGAPDVACSDDRYLGFSCHAALLVSPRVQQS